MFVLIALALAYGFVAYVSWIVWLNLIADSDLMEPENMIWRLMSVGVVTAFSCGWPLHWLFTGFLFPQPKRW